MAVDPTRNDARVLAEAARQARQRRASFAADLFLGRVRSRSLFPFPEQDPADRAQAEPHLERLAGILREELDPDRVEQTRTLPDRAFERLREAGAFRLKIPREYGGLGLSQTNYSRIVAAVSSWCGSTAIWMSGHQSIGLSTPLQLFGTDEQKARYLPRLASGWLSAFALTEPEAGSDPARMQTRAEPTADGRAFRLKGEKLWCTNGPAADVIVVMARTPDRLVNGRALPQISAFIVETAWPGVETLHRCSFMGYGGIQSGLLRFRDVRVPAENLLWEAGQGLKLALVTLNTGRLTLPATNAAAAGRLVRISRLWAAERQQWGERIGDLEAIAVSLGWMASHTYAMQALSDYAAALADRHDADIRIEAAAAKLFCSEALFSIADQAVQIRGGRGYETADSLRARGETPWPVERLFREARLNRIVEGTSEILRLFLAREALDPHLERAAAFLDPHATRGRKVRCGLQLALVYPLWFLGRCLPLPVPRPPGLSRALVPHWRAVARESRRLARRIVLAMLRHGRRLEHRQALLGRLVDDGVDLLAMAVTLARAARPERRSEAPLADLFCRHARVRFQTRRRHPRRLDGHGAALARRLLDGNFPSLERDLILASEEEMAGPHPQRPADSARGYGGPAGS